MENRIGAASVALSLLLSGCSSFADPTYAVFIQNHCATAIRVTVANPEDSAEDLLDPNAMWIDIAAGSETSVGVATVPMEVRVVVLERDSSLGADITVPAGSINQPEVVIVKGNDCPS